MRPGAHHRPKSSSCFSWARIPDQFGSVRYRLYRRDQHNVLHCELHTFRLGTSRAEIACTLLNARRQLRDLVDEIDLALMGVT